MNGPAYSKYPLPESLMSLVSSKPIAGFQLQGSRCVPDSKPTPSRLHAHFLLCQMHMLH